MRCRTWWSQHRRHFPGVAKRIIQDSGGWRFATGFAVDLDRADASTAAASMASHCLCLQEAGPTGTRGQAGGHAVQSEPSHSLGWLLAEGTGGQHRLLQHLDALRIDTALGE